MAIDVAIDFAAPSAPRLVYGLSTNLLPVRRVRGSSLRKSELRILARNRCSDVQERREGPRRHAPWLHHFLKHKRRIAAATWQREPRERSRSTWSNSSAMHFVPAEGQGGNTDLVSGLSELQYAITTPRVVLAADLMHIYSVRAAIHMLRNRLSILVHPEGESA